MKRKYQTKIQTQKNKNLYEKSKKQMKPFNINPKCQFSDINAIPRNLYEIKPIH